MFLIWVSVGLGPGIRPEGWLRYSAHPSVPTVCRGHAQGPAFLPPRHPVFAAGSSKVAIGFLVSLYLLDLELAPTEHAGSYF